MPPIRHPLTDGRWHWQHGPIDLVIGAEGDAAAVAAAHEAAWRRFQGVLRGLVAELPLLKLPIVDRGDRCPLDGTIAQRMWSACEPHAHGVFITPMAAVAGSVAEELIADYAREGVDRAWINNGGDIALHLAPGHALRVGLFADLARFKPGTPMLSLDGRFEVSAASGVRGIATSGWRGRSFSLGIADSVTVLARSASVADAAATVIANAVNVDDARIVRRPASQLKDDTDLGDIEVTVDVPPLPAARIDEALRLGARRARELRACGLIEAAVLSCQGRFVAIDEGLRLAPIAAGSVLA